jgi:DNA-binding GntR family transcriptional regulator
VAPSHRIRRRSCRRISRPYRSRNEIVGTTQRLDVAAKEHLGILDACLDHDVELAVTRLAKHIEISREHTLGIRPMRWSVSTVASTVS